MDHLTNHFFEMSNIFRDEFCMIFVHVSIDNVFFLTWGIAFDDHVLRKIDSKLCP